MRGQEQGGAGGGGGEREDPGKEEREVERSGVVGDAYAHNVSARTFPVLGVVAPERSRPEVFWPSKDKLLNRPIPNPWKLRWERWGTEEGKPILHNCSRAHVLSTLLCIPVSQKGK